jgi:peptidoglycan/LPS O-acetylase OafA/YrhL
MNQKIFALESLRGIAAIFVALYHYPSTSFLYLENGGRGVSFFFVLSGFVISLNYIDKINSFSDLLNFQIKRFFRLYPTHITILFIILTVQILKYYVVNFTEFKSGQTAFGEWYTLKDFIASLFLIQGIFNNFYYLSWSGAAWSISTEFYTYVIFALLFMLKKKIMLAIILIVLLMKTLGFFDLFYIKNIFIIFNNVFFSCIFNFSIGILMYFLYIYLDKKFFINNFLSFFFIMTLMFIKIFFNDFFLKYDFLIYSFIIVNASLLDKKTYLYKILNSRILIFLGTISYSFYLIHQTVIYFVVQFFRFILQVEFKIEEKSGSVAGTLNPYIDTIIHIVYLILSVLISYFLYKFVEKRFRSKSNFLYYKTT